MAEAMLVRGKRTLSHARPYDVYVVAESMGTTVRVFHTLRLAQAIVGARTFCDVPQAQWTTGCVPPKEVRSVEIWLEGIVNVYACGSAEVGFCGDEPNFPVAPGRYEWVDEKTGWRRLGRG